MTLWFDIDCTPKVLIDDDDQSNSGESDNGYENDFVINEKQSLQFVKSIR